MSDLSTLYQTAETITNAYADAAQLASDETALPPETFPSHCPYTVEQLLDKGFYPAARAIAPALILASRITGYRWPRGGVAGLVG
ncbi:DUF29 family protein [uncultured Thiodictyon sp.]|uniref:DUF29 family protein n=1 Tax=uncultured Thiodictyon sp. TaxID=1846217 RepID=UPI0025F9167A|nr:DUF29 family protein [uncultured Thiodictyon sp.]